jgi:tRNA dimethylallyltransferase
MVEMRMRQQNVAEAAEAGPGTQQLALRALAAIDEETLAAGAHQQGRQSALGRWGARGGAEKCQLEHAALTTEAARSDRVSHITGIFSWRRSSAISPSLNNADRRPVVIVAGPTASGKSALALGLAEAFAGTIINADALQVYRDLPILTSSPDAAARARVPHRLYGWLDASERGSVGRWREAALAALVAAHAAGRLPLAVGGTGMYLRALRDGLAAIPSPPPQIRAEAAALYRELGGEGFRALLARLDPEAASILPPADRQRLTRAFAVVRATGRPIGTWRRRQTEPAPYRFATILLMPPREALYRACDTRFERMIADGALDEAAAVATRGLAPDLPAMKAVGLPELLRHLRGEIPLGEAIGFAQQQTRRYAKRQVTWFRHQMRPDLLLNEQYSESLLRCSCHFVDQFLLTVPG